MPENIYVGPYIIRIDQLNREQLQDLWEELDSSADLIYDRIRNGDY